MIDGKKLIAIIPVRMGSKRLRSKNIKNFRGRPLFVWTIKSAQASKYIDEIIPSGAQWNGVQFRVVQFLDASANPLIVNSLDNWGIDDFKVEAFDPFYYDWNQFRDEHNYCTEPPKSESL